MAGRSSRTRLAAFATVVGLGMSLGLTACGGGDISESDILDVITHATAGI